LLHLDSGYTLAIQPYGREIEAMITRIQRWGNSQGLRLSKELLTDAGLQVGEEVNVIIREGEIVVTPLRRVRGGHDLRELVSRIPKDYKPEKLDWGGPAGREVW
jgi:antitoxin MazE